MRIVCMSDSRRWEETEIERITIKLFEEAKILNIQCCTRTHSAGVAFHSVKKVREIAAFLNECADKMEGKTVNIPDGSRPVVENKEDIIWATYTEQDENE